MTRATEVRESTDESLRVERDRADAAVDSRLERVEARTDQAVLDSREATDSATLSARTEVDRRASRTPQETGVVEASRAREDVEVDRKREVADTATRVERGERKRYLQAFLAAERGRTDEDLTEERGLADTLVLSRDEFLANVSHDLRALLGGLMLTTGLLDKAIPEGEAGDRVRKLTGAAGRYVARMDRLLNDLLDVASIEAGKLLVAGERVVVAGLVEETVAAFGPVAEAKHITLLADVPGDLGDASLDGDRLLQVLANLLWAESVAGAGSTLHAVVPRAAP
jgi:signal transduction histidine kinase